MKSANAICDAESGGGGGVRLLLLALQRVTGGDGLRAILQRVGARHRRQKRRFGCFCEKEEKRVYGVHETSQRAVVLKGAALRA